MKCRNCGNKIADENVNYCPNCGLALKGQAENTDPYADSVAADESYNFHYDRSKLIEYKKERRIGWGWFVMWGLISVGLYNIYKGYNNYSDLTLAAFTVSISLYFLFRNIVFKKIENQRTRSTLAGIIGYVLAGFVVGFMARATNPPPPPRDELADKIRFEGQRLNDYLGSFQRQCSSLEDDLISEPVSQKDIDKNVEVMTSIVLLNKAKDSMLVNSYKIVQAIVDSVYEHVPSSREDIKDYHFGFAKLIDKAKEIAVINNNLYKDLLDYHSNMLTKPRKSVEAAKSYEKNKKRSWNYG